MEEPMEPRAAAAGTLIVKFYPQFAGHKTTAIPIQDVDNFRLLDALTNALETYVEDTTDWQISASLLDDLGYLDCTQKWNQCNKNFGTMWKNRLDGAQHGLHSLEVFVGPTYLQPMKGKRANCDEPVGDYVDHETERAKFELSFNEDGSRIVVLMQRFLLSERDILPSATFNNGGRTQRNVQVLVRYRGSKDWKTCEVTAVKRHFTSEMDRKIDIQWEIDEPYDGVYPICMAQFKVVIFDKEYECRWMKLPHERNVAAPAAAVARPLDDDDDVRPSKKRRAAATPWGAFMGDMEVMFEQRVAEAVDIRLAAVSKQRETALEKKDRQLAKRNEELKEKVEQLAQRDEELAKKDEQLARAAEALRAKIRQLAQANNELKEKNRLLLQAAADLEEKDERLEQAKARLEMNGKLKDAAAALTAQFAEFAQAL